MLCLFLLCPVCGMLRGLLFVLNVRVCVLCLFLLCPACGMLRGLLFVLNVRGVFYACFCCVQHVECYVDYCLF